MTTTPPPEEPVRNADDALASAGAHFIKSTEANKERRMRTRLMQRLWQENHFSDAFLAEFGVDRGPGR